MGNMNHLHNKLQIGQRDREGVRILDLSGRLTACDSEAALRNEIAALEKAGAVNVILNFADAEIDEAGVETLVLCAAMLKQSGGALKLVNVKPRRLELMALTKLATEFDCFRDEQDAVDSFYPDRAIHRYDVLEFVNEQSRKADQTPQEQE